MFFVATMAFASMGAMASVSPISELEKVREANENLTFCCEVTVDVPNDDVNPVSSSACSTISQADACQKAFKNGYELMVELQEGGN